MLDRISVHGARQHNLKNISVEIPRNTFTVITGLSGSGKSSLAFDTIYAEGQRRYVETLSPYARQFLDQMERPEVDSIDGLSPAISIEQKTTTRSPRSTVGTVTEIYDYLRLLFASIGIPHCPLCGAEIAKQSPEQILEQVFSLHQDERIMILAPIVRGRKGEYKKELETIAKGGFRARIDGVLRSLDEPMKLDKRKNHTIEVVVDRLLIKPGIEKRLENSIQTASEVGRRAGDCGGSGRARAALFGKAGLPERWHKHSATRAALVFVQQSVWRLRDVQGRGQHLGLRSGEGDSGSVEAVAGRRPGTRLHLLLYGIGPGRAGRSLRNRSLDLLRGVAEEGAHSAALREQPISGHSQDSR